MEDEMLMELALEAQHYPPRSLQRQRALNRLIVLIRKSRRLAKPQIDQWNYQVYEDLWNETLSVVFLEICIRIGCFSPEFSVMAWVNSLINYRFRDVVKRTFYEGGMTGLPRNYKSSAVRLSDELEEVPAPIEDPNFLRQFIMNDPEERLTEHIRGRPEATFRFLLLARLEKLGWDEVSTILGSPPIPKQTLCSFFNRQLRQTEKYFQKYLAE